MELMQWSDFLVLTLLCTFPEKLRGEISLFHAQTSGHKTKTRMKKKNTDSSLSTFFSLLQFTGSIEILDFEAI